VGASMPPTEFSMKFTDQTIVITGASDGIGAELARQLATERPKLVLAARGREALERVAADCIARGAQAIAVPTDVAREDDCRRLIETAVAQYGGIDVLVNNAGVSMHAEFESIEDFSTFERLWRINCLGTIACTRFAWPQLKARRGLVVGVSSLAGKAGVPGRTTYCASKFAQTGFLEALRIEAEPLGIAVLGVYPGVVATEIRRRGLNAQGRPAGVSGLEERGAMPVDECARQIVAAMRARRRELVMTAKGKIGLWLKLIAPRLVDNMARAALAKTTGKAPR
jgi:short-subunit dehydrogenase